jgi:hypothetical protein
MNFFSARRSHAVGPLTAVSHAIFCDPVIVQCWFTFSPSQHLAMHRCQGQRFWRFEATCLLGEPTENVGQIVLVAIVLRPDAAERTQRFPQGLVGALAHMTEVDELVEQAGELLLVHGCEPIFRGEIRGEEVLRVREPPSVVCKRPRRGGRGVSAIPSSRLSESHDAAALRSWCHPRHRLPQPPRSGKLGSPAFCVTSKVSKKGSSKLAVGPRYPALLFFS